MEKKTISFFQISLVIITVAGLNVHVIIIPMLLDASRRDAWITILVSGAIYLLWIPLVYYLYKKMQNQSLLVWLKAKLGKVPAYIIISILVTYSFMFGLVTFKETLTFLSFYLPRTPEIVLAIILGIIGYFNANGGIKSIALTTGVFLPIVLVLGFFVMTANFPQKDYSFLKPFLEHGLHPVIQGLVYPASGFVEIFLIIFLQQHISSKSKKKISFFFIIALSLIILTWGPTIGAITEFGPVVATMQRYPAFEEWRLVSIGRYIEHLDFLSVYQWFVGSFIRSSLSLFLIPDLLQIKNVKKRNHCIKIAAVLSIILVQFSITDVTAYYITFKYIVPASLIVVLLLSVILLITTFIRKGERNTYETSQTN